MEWISSNYVDIDRYYTGTFIKLAKFGDKLFKVTKVNSDRVMLRDAENRVDYQVTLRDDCPFTVDMVLPHKTVYQCGKYAFLMSRIPAKQYYRGIHQDNTMITKLDANGWVSVGLDMGSLQGFVEKAQYVPPKKLLQGYVSVALSSRWSVTKTGMIFLDDLAVGTLDLASMSVLSIRKEVANEFQQALDKFGGIHG